MQSSLDYHADLNEIQYPQLGFRCIHDEYEIQCCIAAINNSDFIPYSFSKHLLKVWRVQEVT